MTGEGVPRVRAYGIACPKCGVVPRQPCRHGGRVLRRPHPKRAALATALPVAVPAAREVPARPPEPEPEPWDWAYDDGDPDGEFVAWPGWEGP